MDTFGSLQAAYDAALPAYYDDEPEAAPDDDECEGVMDTPLSINTFEESSVPPRCAGAVQFGNTADGWVTARCELRAGHGGACRQSATRDTDAGRQCVTVTWELAEW